VPDHMKCPDCVVGNLQTMNMENDAYYFCDACGWSEWDDEDFFFKQGNRDRSRDSDGFDVEQLDW